MSVFYKAQGLPICSTMLFPTRQEARSVPCGDLALGFCSVCGFISNVAFEAKVQSYTFPREDTQSFSPMFSQFAQRLARDLIARYGLHDKEIIEIGCGQGEFLTLLCELGHNRGRGFDPAYLPRRGPVGAGWSTYGMDAEYGSLSWLARPTEQGALVPTTQQGVHRIHHQAVQDHAGHSNLHQAQDPSPRAPQNLQ